jgi:hypothetical protein
MNHISYASIGGDPTAGGPSRARARRHAGPPLGVVASVFVALFLIGLYFVSMFAGSPVFPGPWEPPATIVSYFRTRPSAVLLCAFFQFGSAVPLGIFTASVVSRLRFLGVSAAGPSIALLGGFAASFNIAAAALVLWVMAYPGIAQDATVVRALYYLSYAFGGPGFSVPFGLLLAGISVPAGLMGLLPRRLVASGLVLAVIGELSWLTLIAPQGLFLIPLTRFPGFIWLIATGFALPNAHDRAAPAAVTADSPGALRSREEIVSMRTLAACLVGSNAALFLFGAVQHIGIALGPFHEPRILPAALVEAMGSLALTWAAAALWAGSTTAQRLAVVANLVAIGGVALGIAALALGAGPRTASNDVYHGMMLALSGASLLALWRDRLLRRLHAG